MSQLKKKVRVVEESIKHEKQESDSPIGQGEAKWEQEQDTARKGVFSDEVAVRRSHGCRIGQKGGEKEPPHQTEEKFVLVFEGRIGSEATIFEQNHDGGISQKDQQTPTPLAISNQPFSSPKGKQQVKVGIKAHGVCTNEGGNSFFEVPKPNRSG